ncbi:hypothetical protein [Bdellovibrio sp. HCB-162]|uniref:hypothetical protein n=1 Tax=Bdellovibrio sp. HCB-162 TaxID=3394234 RepID=UPI0039BC9425
MKIRARFLKVWTMALLVFSVSGANADSLENFCSNPYKTVCERQQNAKTRTGRIEAIEKRLSDRALDETFEYLYGSKNRPSSFTLDDITYMPKKTQRRRALGVFYASLRQQFRAYLKQNHVPTDLGITELKSHLSRAIELSKEIPEENKAKMQDLLQQTRLIAFNDLDPDEEGALTTSDINKIYKGCTKNHFLDNAFADSNKKGEMFVIICPGEIVGSIEFSKDYEIPQKYQLVPLIMTLGHELSHHFDFSVMPEAYSTTLKSVMAMKDELKHSKIENYMGEITADLWGIKSFVVATRNMEPEFQMAFIKGAVNDLCSTEDDGIHPSGEFRINRLLPPYICPAR